MLARPPTDSPPQVLSLGRIDYQSAYRLQLEHHEQVIAARASGQPDPGRLLMLEHDPPVITVTARAGASAHLLASPDDLSRAGVTVVQTDRGGDITYHGPGQLVVYPIIDLNLYRLRLHDYMRLLEAAVIDALAAFGVRGERDKCATGVWVPRPACAQDTPDGVDGSAKICAMGVRIRRWVTLHGLALNVSTNLDHFGFILPCGLAGRRVTSLRAELGEGCPSMDQVRGTLADALSRRLRAAPDRAALPGPA